MPLTVVDRFHPTRRNALQAAVDSGRLRLVDEVTLLEPEQMLPLARFSAQLLVIFGLFFILLNLAAYIWRTGHQGASLSFGLVMLWLALNVVGYFLILPLHELLHGLTISLLGGRPHYGAKLPIALYCGAREQIFERGGYMLIAAVPFVLITLAGMLLTLLAPTYSPYFLFALVGNAAGAAGDLWMVQRLRSLEPGALIEDVETGYRAWMVTPLAEGVTIEDV